MATEASSRRISTSLDFVRPILRSIDKLPTKSRPGLIGVIVFMVLAIATMKLLAGSAAEIVIMILGVAAAMIVIATGSRRDGWSVVLVVALLGFSYLLLAHIKPDQAHAAGVVVSAGADAGNDSAVVSGRIRYADTNDPVGGAFVDVEGYGARSDTTSESGWFEIRVPRRILRQRNDSVALAIRTTHTELFVHPLRDFPLTLSLKAPLAAPPAAPTAWRQPTAARGLARLAASVERARPLVAQQAVEARVILDSVKTLHDGSGNSTWWSFDVDVNHAHAMTIPQRSYDRNPHRNMLHLGGEVTADMPRGGHLTIHIRGLRNAFIGVNQVNGDAWIFEQSLRPEQPVQYQMHVVHEDDAGKGEFVFYYTVVRRGTPNLRAGTSPSASPAVAT